MTIDNQANRTLQKSRGEGLVRIAPLLAIPAVLAELGCPSEPVLQQAGFDPAHFEGDPDRKIDFLAGSKLLACCVRASGCRHFGLLLGERANCSTLGITGFMLRFAPTVGEALHALVRHLELHDQGGIPLFNTSDGVSSFGYAIYQSGVEAAEQIYDLAVAVVCNIMRELCGPQWKPVQVMLSRRTPRHTAAHERFFRAPLHFNAAQNLLIFPAHWLDSPLSNADPMLFRHLEREANALHNYQFSSTTEKVRRLLHKSLAKQSFAASDIARALCIHERTLHRRLQSEGTCYRHELMNIRSAMARQMLTQSDMPLASIAKALGYADSSALVRSFKRWTGQTPIQWRSLQH